MDWMQRETDDQRERRAIREIGEAVGDECYRLVRRHNGWILNALRIGEKSLGQLYRRQPPAWGRDLEAELEWMEELDLVYRDLDEDLKEVWRAC
jgi:hypothetical protein